MQNRTGSLLQPDFRSPVAKFTCPSRLLFRMALIVGTLLLAPGCRLQESGNRNPNALPRLLLFVDHTGSAEHLTTDLIRDGNRIALAAPARTRIEACLFRSDVPLAPFYTGTVRHPAAFYTALAKELSRPAIGRKTLGAPLLRRIRARLRVNPIPTYAVWLTDGGFDDLPEIAAEVRTLASEPAFKGLYILPVTLSANVYIKLEAALAPLGNRVRIAASADAGEAIRELQRDLRTTASFKKGNER